MKIDPNAHVITLEKPPGRPKKITGTRFAPVLGLSPWASEFSVWCDITGIYKEPFTENQYTRAGNVIEPKVIAYLDRKYHYGRGLVKDPFAWFGKTKEELHYDHFPESPVFGGMWDARTETAVYELKTTKRVEDWYRNGELCPPEYYKLQGALYAWLLGLDDFRLVLTMPEDADYAHPEMFVPTPENTIVKKFSLRAEYPDFEPKIEAALRWREEHILHPVSPPWDESRKCDKEIVKALTTAHVVTTEGDPVEALISRIEPLQKQVEALAPVQDELKTLREQLKTELGSRMLDSDQKIEALGGDYSFEVSRSITASVDTARLKADKLYDKYRKTASVTKLTINRRNAE